MPLWKLEDSLHLGDIIKSHSYLGSVKVAFLFPETDKLIKADSYLFIEFMGKPVPFLVEQISWTDDSTAIIKFADIDSEEAAKELRDKRILYPVKNIPPKLRRKFQPASTFEGFKIVDNQGKYLGIVKEVIENGPQSLLEVENKGISFLIPVHEDIIVEVDLEKETLIVILPEGLLDVNG